VNSPEQLGVVGVSVPLWADRLFASTEARLVGPQRALQGKTVGLCADWGATLHGRSLVRGLDVSLSLRNLLNRRFDVPVSTEHTQPTVAGDGITLWGTVGYAF
jgi:hypothetical protein